MQQAARTLGIELQFVNAQNAAGTYGLRCESLFMAQTASSRQRNLVPAMEAKRTVGGRGRHRRD
jgi:hypothetical protein